MAELQKRNYEQVSGDQEWFPDLQPLIECEEAYEELLALQLEMFKLAESGQLLTIYEELVMVLQGSAYYIDYQCKISAFENLFRVRYPRAARLRRVPRDRALHRAQLRGHQDRDLRKSAPGRDLSRVSPVGLPDPQARRDDTDRENNPE